MSSSLRIEFNFQAKVTQEIIMIDKSIDADSLIHGLQNGDYFTTINQDETIKYITDIDGNKIAQILEQDSEDVEIHDIELAE